MEKELATSWAKANWDATIYKKTRKRGTNIIIKIVVVRYWHAKVLLLNSIMNLSFLNVKHYGGLQCDEIGLGRVCLERDAKVIIDTVLGTKECSTWYGTRIEDVILFLKQGPSWSLGFIHRERNQVAHLLAKFGLSIKEEVWIEEYPLVSKNVVLAKQVYQ